MICMIPDQKTKQREICRKAVLWGGKILANQMDAMHKEGPSV